MELGWSNGPGRLVCQAYTSDGDQPPSRHMASFTSAATAQPCQQRSSLWAPHLLHHANLDAWINVSGEVHARGQAARHHRPRPAAGHSRTHRGHQQPHTIALLSPRARAPVSIIRPGLRISAVVHERRASIVVELAIARHGIQGGHSYQAKASARNNFQDELRIRYPCGGVWRSHSLGFRV